MRVLLISTYELGHQPFGLASPAAWLRKAGVDVSCLDLSRQSFDADLAGADIVGFHLPMHTATRLAVPIIERVRRLHPRTQICCYGLYAPLNESFLRSRGVRHVLGAEYEQALLELSTGSMAGTCDAAPSRPGSRGRTDAGLPRLSFLTPDRSGLPPLSQYATLQLGAQSRVVGYTEASRGCKHFCRHCPVVPIYNGRFRIVPVDVVCADVRSQVRAGAQHITFGDPDFFNGIGHAVRVIDSVSREFPRLTYDVTIKVEHLLRHRHLLSRLQETGCLFVTSAVESFDDGVLSALRKGHTRADIDDALAACRRVGLTLSPTFVAFTPWTTVGGYCAFLGEIDRLGLVDQIASVQLGLRLLLPEGSLLLSHPDVRPHIRPFDAVTLAYPWRHPDSRVDRYGEAVRALVGRRINAPRRSVFDEVWMLAHELAGQAPGTRTTLPIDRADVPYLNEPWYC